MSFKVAVYGPVTQSNFLSQMQIGTRLQVQMYIKFKTKKFSFFLSLSWQKDASENV